MSFIGYGESPLYSNANPAYVNPTSSNNPANFGSNEIPGLTSPPYYPDAFYGVKSNVYAASGHATIKGGSRNKCRKCLKGGKSCGCGGFKGISTMKRKIKNIVKVYKMKGKKTIRHIKNSIKNLFSERKTRFLSGGKKYKKKTVKNITRSKRPSKKRHSYKGGYSQYQNNLPMTQVYSLGNVNLPASESALASPPPYQVLSNCVNCVDNYNHYTNQGFPSRGH
jgi:hypothetical protein